MTNQWWSSAGSAGTVNIADIGKVIFANSVLQLQGIDVVVTQSTPLAALPRVRTQAVIRYGVTHVEEIMSRCLATFLVLFKKRQVERVMRRNVQQDLAAPRGRFSSVALATIASCIAVVGLFVPQAMNAQTRTWRFPYQGTCQGGAASMPVQFGATNAPTYIPCSTSATPKMAVASGGTTTNYWVRLTVPPGNTGSYTYSLIYDSTDTTHTATAEIFTSCIATGTSSSTITWVDSGTALALAPTVSGADSLATAPFSLTCADGASLYVQLVWNTSNMTAPINFSYNGLDITGNQ